MRRWLSLATGLSLLVGVGPASAGELGWVGPARVSEVRAAVAQADPPTSWIELHAAGGALVLFVGVEPGAAVDLAGSEWLDALDGATAPRIVPAGGVSACHSGDARPLIHDLSRGDAASRVAPVAIATLSGPDALVDFADAHGATLDPALAVSLAASARVLALGFDVPTDGAWTAALRVHRSAVSARLGAWPAAPALRATLFGIAEHELAPAGTLAGASHLDVTWRRASADSDYPERLAEVAPGSFIVESDGVQSLRGFVLLPGASGAIEPAPSRYFGPQSPCARALSHGAATGDVAPRACLAGTLVADAPSCTPAPSELDCDGADDLALAVSGLALADVRVTRASGTAAAGTTLALVGSSATLMPSPTVVATRSDSTGCVTNTGSGSGGYGGGSSGSGGSYGTGGYGAAPGGYGAEGGDDGYGTSDGNVHVDGGCSCGSNSSGDGTSDDACSGNGSSEGDTCSGSGSEGESGGDSCGGDGASDGDTCSGSGSSGGGDSCGGEGASSGDTCSGGGGGGESCGGGSGGGDCRVGRRGRRSPIRLSPLLMAASAIGLWQRRRSRPRPR